MLQLARALILSLSLIVGGNAAWAQSRGPLCLAASSLQGSLDEAAARWTAKGHAKPVLSYAASSALARQVEAGAPADLFLSADEAWMDDVAGKGLIQPGTRQDFLGNRLVLIAPLSNKVRVVISPGFSLARALGGGRLAMADPGAVPAGKYGKEALVSLKVWQSVEAKVARAENVRAALALVERGEAPLGIVYATDALASKLVRVVGVFPATSHKPIVYPLARLKASAHPEAEGFRRFLLSSEAKVIFTRYGFTVR
jgi:molybdate transport system substrate-binding protein